MFDGWQLFSITLLVEVEENLFKRWVALYALALYGRGPRQLRDVVGLGRSSL
jgi:hypothetical protein